MSSSLTLPRPAQDQAMWLNLRMVMAITAGLGLLFQVGHFYEHAFQFVVWCLGDLSQICGRDMPWISEWAGDFVAGIGRIIAPAADMPRQSMLGLEVLHLIGNSIFLATLGCLYFVTDKNKWVRWGFYIEAFHLYEHIMLTSTAFFIGKPIGLSTFFGAVSLGPREFAVGTRVSWHFVMNLLPMPFAMLGIMEYWDQRQTTQKPSQAG